MQTNQRLYGLPPILPAKPVVLILGSMPSVKSLEKQEYYGNPRNHFWKILFSMFGEPPRISYEAKIAWLKEKGIALWDTIGSCLRNGSLDANIKKEEANDIISLLRDYPSVQLIICNGGKSYDTLCKHIPVQAIQQRGCKIVKLPSTSPIPGRNIKSIEEKQACWAQAILPFVSTCIEKKQ